LRQWLPAPVWVIAHDNLNGVWIDEGSRALRGTIDLGREPEDLPLVVGHGWYEPERDAALDWRLSKGRRSWLRIPVRTQTAARITVRARRGVAELPVRMRVEVNGVAAGEADLGVDWADAAFEVPREAVRRGLNDVAFLFSAAPRQDVPGYHATGRSVAFWEESYGGPLIQPPVLPLGLDSHLIVQLVDQGGDCVESVFDATNSQNVLQNDADVVQVRN